MTPDIDKLVAELRDALESVTPGELSWNILFSGPPEYTITADDRTIAGFQSEADMLVSWFALTHLRAILDDRDRLAKRVEELEAAGKALLTAEDMWNCEIGDDARVAKAMAAFRRALNQEKAG